MKAIYLILVTTTLFWGVASHAQTVDFSFDFEDLQTGSIGSPEGVLNQPNANQHGWHARFPDFENIVYVSDEASSPWNAGGRQSVVIQRSVPGGGAPALFHYFTDQFNLSCITGNVDVQGSLGRPLEGSGYTVSFDMMMGNIATQPIFRFFDGRSRDEDVVLNFQIRHDNTFRINDQQVQDMRYTFSRNMWYRFVISNLNLVNQTWDLAIYEWDGSEGFLIYQASSLPFMLPVPSIDRFMIRSNSENTNPIFIDNFSIVGQ